jgi:hypothetical protein
MENEHIEETISHKETPGVSKNENDFFSDIPADDELKQFIGHMGQEKEKIDAPDFGLEEELEEATADEQELMGQMSQATPEHQELAKFILIQMDRIMSFSFSLFSGMESERYATRLSKASDSDYETEILAGLLYKYQLKMSLEYMFMIAIVMIYTPQASKAIKDRKEMRKTKEWEQERERAEFYKQSVTPTTPPKSTKIK